MRALRHLLFLLGLAAVILLVSRLPDDVFATTQAILLLAAGALFLLVAGGAFLTPARRALARFFAFEARDGPAFMVANDREWRGLVKPIFSALVLVAVAGVAQVLRSAA